MIRSASVVFVLTLKVSTRRAAERIARFTFEHMRYTGRRRVHCSAKPQVVPLADGAFVEAFERIGAEDPYLEKAQLAVGNLGFCLVQDPSPFDVLPLQNLYGDIMSDLCAGLVGGLGRRPEPTSAIASRSSRRSTARPPISPTRTRPTPSRCC